jgi:hypothetical protein
MNDNGAGIYVDDCDGDDEDEADQNNRDGDRISIEADEDDGQDKDFKLESNVVFNLNQLKPSKEKHHHKRTHSINIGDEMIKKQDVNALDSIDSSGN